MYNLRGPVCGIIIVLSAQTALAGIPEPDVILYGQVRIHGQVVSQSDSVTVIARVLKGDPPAPDPSMQPVGTYHMDDNPGAGDRYVLRVRIENMAADGSTTQSNNAALVGQTIRFFYRLGNGPEQPTGAPDYVITSAGAVVADYHLGTLDPVKPDFDKDGDVDLVDWNAFSKCFTGPAIPYGPGHLPSGCAQTIGTGGLIAADLNQDGAVDQMDFGIFQRCFGGPDHAPAADCAD